MAELSLGARRLTEASAAIAVHHAMADRVGGSTSVEASTGVVVSAKGWEAARRECILMSAELGKSVATR